MTIIGVLLGVAWLLLTGYAIYDLITTRTVSGRAKVAWAVAILVFPFAGVLVYLFSHVGAAGPPRIPDQFDSDIELDRLRGS